MLCAIYTETLQQKKTLELGIGLAFFFYMKTVFQGGENTAASRVEQNMLLGGGLFHSRVKKKV